MTQETPNIHLVFRSRERLLSVSLRHVVEVVPAFSLLHTPGLSPVLAGMIAFRGDILPVIDSAVLLGEAATAIDPDRQFIILRDAGYGSALLIDAVVDIIDIGDEASIRSFGTGSGHPFVGLVQMGEDMILIIDVPALERIEGIGTLPDLSVTLLEQQG
ncbi:MAG: chemotaxis protein CheW [Bacteroidetes bacterium]|nr:chemotaxis protein CheW [Bacteroidota bacterium]